MNQFEICAILIKNCYKYLFYKAQKKFVAVVTHSWASAGPNCIIWRLCHSPIHYVVMTRVELADKLCYCLFLCFVKVYLSHRLRPGIEPVTKCTSNKMVIFPFFKWFDYNCLRRLKKLSVFSLSPIQWNGQKVKFDCTLWKCFECPPGNSKAWNTLKKI